MHRFYQIFAIAIIGFITSCSGIPGENVALDSQKMEAYINSYREIRQNAPDYLSKVNTGDINEQKQGFSDIEKVLESNGLTYMEFVKINAKVGAIFSIIQAENFMSKMEDLESWGENSIDEGVKLMQESIDDPDVPEETKEELRKSIKELEASKKELKVEYSKNEKWANLVLDKTKKITNLKVEEKDVEIVEQYIDEITEVYTGGIIPENYIINESL